MSLGQLLFNLAAVALIGAVLLILMRPRQADAQSTRLARAGSGLWAFLVRWQEHSGWAPLCAAAALLAWAVLGALDRTAAVDLLAPIGMAPVLALYAYLALGGTLLAVKRGRRKLTDEEQATFWQKVVSGTWRDGAVIVYVGERAFALVVLAMLLWHFRVGA